MSLISLKYLIRENTILNSFQVYELKINNLIQRLEKINYQAWNNQQNVKPRDSCQMCLGFNYHDYYVRLL